MALTQQKVSKKICLLYPETNWDYFCLIVGHAALTKFKCIPFRLHFFPLENLTSGEDKENTEYQVRIHIHLMKEYVTAILRRHPVFGGRLVCYTAAFSVVTQRSSPLNTVCGEENCVTILKTAV